MFIIGTYGAASSYAFTRMIQPEYGASIEAIRNGYFAKLNGKYALANKDPNGGVAATISLSAGKTVNINKYMRVGVFAEYQHLFYGNLYNNGIGGGVSGTLSYARFFAKGILAALYGLSGDVGYHLLSAGNDYVVKGELGYRLKSNISTYVFITQQRYIGNGNALTYQGVGGGLKVSF